MTNLFRGLCLACLLGVFLPGCVLSKVRPQDDSGLIVPSPLPQDMTDSAFAEAALAQMSDLKRLFKGLDQAVRYAAARKDLFSTPGGTVLLPETKAELLDIWAPFLDYLVGVEQIRIRHSSFWKINYLSHKEAHAASFALTFTALLGMYYYGSHFIALADNLPQHEVLFNEKNPGVIADAYARLKYNVLNIVTYSQVYWGHRHFQDWCRAPLLESGDSLLRWAVDFETAYSDSADAFALGRNFNLTGQNGLDLTRQQVFLLWFPLQKGLAAWMGASRYKPAQRTPLITGAMADSLRALLQPGDILYERGNWVMSNIGLPGFWPHAFLYAGTFPEMDAYFKADTATARTVRGLSGGACSTLTAYLATAFPEQARWYGEPADDRGPRRVIEARSEGVVFTSLTEACAGDYIGAVRPRLTRQEKAVALIQAFSYGGRPYDFDFDFASDAALVCTEVVYKAYQKRPESRGVSFDLVEILGRLTLPPNRMVAQFDREYGTENRQADFVAFIDASEKQGRSFFSDAAGFRKSHLRPKWDFLLD